MPKYKYIYEVLYLLDKDKYKLPWLILLFLFVSIMDLIGIGVIGPYISLIFSPDSFSPVIENGLKKLGFSGTRESLILYIGYFLILIFTIKLECFKILILMLT